MNEKPTFTPIFDGLVQQYGLTTASIYGRVWRYCQSEHKACFAKQETIASELSISVPTVKRKIKILIQEGYLTKEFGRYGVLILKLTNKSFKVDQNDLSTAHENNKVDHSDPQIDQNDLGGRSERSTEDTIEDTSKETNFPTELSASQIPNLEKMYSEINKTIFGKNHTLDKDTVSVDKSLEKENISVDSIVNAENNPELSKDNISINKGEPETIEELLDRKWLEVYGVPRTRNVEVINGQY